MRLSDFSYDLPEALIAAYPAEHREESRLMVVDRAAGSVSHRRFSAVGEYLAPGDALVLNNTRVLPARVFGKKTSGGAVELLFVSETERGVWRAMARGKNLRPGTTVEVAGARFRLREKDGEMWRVETGDALPGLLYRVGSLPLPPYIVQRRRALGREERWAGDAGRYQTVFAKEEGAVAAPTAGLHFTPELLESLRARGVRRAEVTLHVGPGTFLPVREDDPALHRMHAEHVSIDGQTAAVLADTRAAGAKVTAVGTTVVRALEGLYAETGATEAAEFDTNLYILPGFEFRMVDRLITNFHLPESTLLMLVAAFAGRDLILRAYREAIAEGYRFYSYGDAMIIL